MSGTIPASLSLGFLNRLRASVSVPSYSALNVTPAYLGDEGIRFTPEGNAAELLDQLAGRVVSANPYLAVTIELPLLRTMSAAAAWYNQMLTNAAIGSVQITPDSTTMPVIYVQNCVIRTPGAQGLNGRGPVMPVSVAGTMIINSALWAAA